LSVTTTSIEGAQLGARDSSYYCFAPTALFQISLFIKQTEAGKPAASVRLRRLRVCV